MMSDSGYEPMICASSLCQDLRVEVFHDNDRGHYVLICPHCGRTTYVKTYGGDADG